MDVVASQSTVVFETHCSNLHQFVGKNKCSKERHYNQNVMASGINIYSQLLISTIRIVDICNKVHLNYVKCIVLFTHHTRIV